MIYTKKIKDASAAAKYGLIIAILIAGGIFFGLRYLNNDGAVNSQENLGSASHADVNDIVLKAFIETHVTAVMNVNDQAFTTYALGELNDICPFYKPDGVTYRKCLSDLIGKESEGKATTTVAAAEKYCTSVSEQYSGIENANLYLSCTAYKLKAA